MIDCDPNLYLFLVRHPEVVVNIWQVMGISKVTLERTGPDTYKGNDAAGTTGTIRMCYSNHDTQVLYAEGAYEGPMFSQPVQAQCVLVLRAGYVQETNGRYYITNRLDAFIHVDHVGLDLVAKTFSPLVTKTVDINFRETAAFVGVVSRTAAANPQGMRRLAGKLTGLDANLRSEFTRLSDDIAAKAQPRETTANRPTRRHRRPPSPRARSCGGRAERRSIFGRPLAGASQSQCEHLQQRLLAGATLGRRKSRPRGPGLVFDSRSGGESYVPAGTFCFSAGMAFDLLALF